MRAHRISTCQLFLWLVAFATAACCAGVASAQSARLYVAENNGTRLSVIDIDSGAVITTIEGFARPRNIAATPDGKKLYVTNDGNNQVITSVDVAANSIAGTISFPTFVSEPLVFLPSGTQAFASLYNTNQIAVVDIASGATVETISVGTPTGLAMNHAATRLYVANNVGDSVVVIDVASRAILATIPVGRGPSKFAITPNDAAVFVSNNGSGDTVSAISAATNNVTATIPVATNPFWLTMHPNGQYLYVGNSQAGHISVINVALQQVVASIPVARAQHLVIDDTGTFLYAAQYYENKVAKISLATGTVVAEFTGLNGPLGVLLVTPTIQRQLAVTATGGGQGTVTSSPSGISCIAGSSTGCSASFVDGAQVALTATASAGSVFAGWSGCSSASTPVIQVTLSADKSCTATFRAPIVPQVGWWSTPDQPGRGYGIEASNSAGPYKVLLSVFAKKRQGEGGWFVAELDMKADASGFAGPMFEIDDGQDLLDIDLPKRKRPLEAAIGNAGISMTTAAEGTLSLPSLGPATPASAVSLRRYEFVEGGLSNPRPSGLPQAGWWTSPEDNRWATFFEVQTTSAGQPVLFGAFHRMQKRGKVNSFFGTATLLSSGSGWLVLSMPLQDCKESIDLDITGKKAKACRTLANRSTTLQFLGSGTSANFTRPEGKTSLLNRYGF